MMTHARQGGSSISKRDMYPRSLDRAFTLIEVLVVVALVAILLALLIPALKSARNQMKSLKCASNLRTVAFEFQLFAQGDSEEGRGDSEQFSGDRFKINDFQDSMYRIDEYWDLGSSTFGPLTTNDSLMLCPAGAPELRKREGFPCGIRAISPTQDVSIALNMRLYQAVVRFGDMKILAPPSSNFLTGNVLSHPYAPLAMDVDGAAAMQKNIQPFYIAPSLLNEEGPYANNSYWAPSKRHGGRTNVVFIGGHVLSSSDSEEENWDWAYQAQVVP